MRTPDMPWVANYLIAGNCNMACRFCYGHWKKDTSTKDIQLEIVDKLAVAGIPSLTLSGGEPLLNDNWVEIVKRAVLDFRMKVHIHTNGLLLDERALNEIETINEKSEHKVRVSLALDGVSNEQADSVRNLGGKRPSEYKDLILLKIEQLIEREVPVALKSVVVAENINGLERIISELPDGLDRLLFTQFSVVGPLSQKHQGRFAISDERFELFKACLPKTPFPIDFRSSKTVGEHPYMFVDTDGKIMTASYEVVGDLMNNSVETLWERIKRSHEIVTDFRL